MNCQYFTSYTIKFTFVKNTLVYYSFIKIVGTNFPNIFYLKNLICFFLGMLTLDLVILFICVVNLVMVPGLGYILSNEIGLIQLLDGLSTTFLLLFTRRWLIVALAFVGVIFPPNFQSSYTLEKSHNSTICQ